MGSSSVSLINSQARSISGIARGADVAPTTSAVKQVTAGSATASLMGSRNKTGDPLIYLLSRAAATRKERRGPREKSAEFDIWLPGRIETLEIRLTASQITVRARPSIAG